ncbi:probable phospholipid-transporting ATPase IA isoform X2 [Chrysoperla carnea]|uniref:probable phospholipid-transporting ATPase IA isoform X2 n=1 Tax=Chrysoperla carnea TaxID=189513 RepID=UPI001D08FBB8|nr:probable phospholipid-transporting ATPase IA isoform X2 [Chrysoperla carnea]
MSNLKPATTIELTHMSAGEDAQDGAQQSCDTGQPRVLKDDDATTATTDRRANTETRIIRLRGPQLLQKFCSNAISTGKYSILSFVPAFLFEQFRKYSNCFFLFIALLQQIPDVSPTGRYTTLVPLLFILTVSALKEILEDYKRHRADDELNNREVDVLSENGWTKVKWMNVKVGDIVKVVNNSFFPADLIVLSSSEPFGMCFIETANLDGETNLKIRQAIQQTATLIDTRDVLLLDGTIECEGPNRNVYDFAGVLISDQFNANLPLGPDQLLQRGAMLRNTSWVFAAVIYTGNDTKLIRNSTKAPLKRSTVDRLTNTQVIMLFGILLLLAFISAGCNEIWSRTHNNRDWYIGLDEIVTRNFGYNLLTFLILYNNLVPISLQVTLEIVRFIQAIFINMDLQMYHEETDTPAMARTSNLNEELGQVKYIFSDKTGTLTQNIMVFKKCAIGGVQYELANTADSSDLIRNLKMNHKDSDLIEKFLTLLSICHTVIPEVVEGKLVYHAASPDERALVEGAKRFGYVFESRTPNSVTINALGQQRIYKILSVLEFSSTRKRMSVVVETPEGKLVLLCKGADTMIYERLGESNSQQKDELLLILEEFATEGLRTLCLAYANITREFYDEWKVKHHLAATSIENREANLESVAELIETNLNLIGATAIEDKLQDGVPETIATLLEANIKIWVLTGDKQETAINIGYASKLIVQGMPILIVNEDSLDATRETIQRHAHDLGTRLGTENEIALVIDGNTLRYALSCELCREFLEVCLSCKVIICCRVSPIQKAEVVDLVTTNTGSVTLAIGDGANDVAMIQKANVGVGISGFEGLQAACASDYSIAQFRFLLRLLLVHGAWNYSRMCKLILYSFYKNICLYVIELWFAVYSAWSGQVLFEQWTIGFYNVLFTALPPFALGIFDRQCSDEVMMKYPKLYSHSQNATQFNVRVFWIWITNGILHSILLFWLPLFAIDNGIIWNSGRDGGYLVLGNTVYTYVVIAVCFKAGLVTSTWTLPSHIAIWGSIGMWFLFMFIYSNVWPIIPVGAIMLGQARMVLSSPVFWFGIFIIPFLTLLPDIMHKVIQISFFKSETDIRREGEALGYHKDSKPSFSRLRRNDKRKFSVANQNSIGLNGIQQNGRPIGIAWRNLSSVRPLSTSHPHIA